MGVDKYGGVSRFIKCPVGGLLACWSRRRKLSTAFIGANSCPLPVGSATESGHALGTIGSLSMAFSRTYDSLRHAARLTAKQRVSHGAPHFPSSVRGNQRLRNHRFPSTANYHRSGAMSGSSRVTSPCRIATTPPSHSGGPTDVEADAG